MGQNETTTNELLLRIKEKYKKMSKDSGVLQIMYAMITTKRFF